MDDDNLPFLLVTHWFTCRNFDTAKRQANRGLMRADGRPWEELVGAMKQANEQLEKGREAISTAVPGR